MIKLEVSFGEAIDKISILQIKRVKILDKNKILFIEEELKSIIDLMGDIGKYKYFLEELYKINLILWENNEKRKLKIKNGIYDNEYVELTKEESLTNDLRFKIKEKINIEFNSSIREQKSYI